MKVKELIARLQKCDQEAEVAITVAENESIKPRYAIEVLENEDTRHPGLVELCLGD